MKRMKLLFTLAIPVLLAQNAAAQTSSRLIGEAHWSNNGAIFTPVDSSSFSYSNGRGGDLTHKLNYDNAGTWTYSGSDSAYTNDLNYIQNFNSSNFITDSTTQYWDGIEWINSTKTLFFYNSGNVLIKTVYQTWGGSNWVNVSSDVFSYNPLNQLYADQYQIWNGISFTATSQKTYYYDASGNRIQEVDQNISGGTSVYSAEYVNTYSGTNQLLSNTYSTWNGTAWVASYEYINTYDSTGDKINQLYQTFNTNTSEWVPQILRNYSGFTNQLPATEMDQTWDTLTGAYNNTIEYTYTYNSFNQLTSSVGESWNIAGFYEFANGDPKANYYYESYAPIATSVKTISSNGGNVNIYPVPAQNMLHIDLTWNQAQSATIAIYDMEGRVMSQWNTTAGTQYNSSVSVNNFADGIYVIKINGAQGQIVKQIVVAH